jgi:hypothetical protein
MPFAAAFTRLFERRLRGFRVVDLAAFACFVTLALVVYAVKADAGREAAALNTVEDSIAEETQRVRLLKAEIAHLEQPDRLERLSVAVLRLSPADPRREAAVDGLGEIAHRVEPVRPPAPPAPVAPEPTR